MGSLSGHIGAFGGLKVSASQLGQRVSSPLCWGPEVGLASCANLGIDDCLESREDGLASFRVEFSIHANHSTRSWADVEAPTTQEDLCAIRTLFVNCLNPIAHYPAQLLYGLRCGCFHQGILASGELLGMLSVGLR
jgi:hypothetical protein